MLENMPKSFKAFYEKVELPKNIEERAKKSRPV
jgi:hypothetical protein